MSVIMFIFSLFSLYPPNQSPEPTAVGVFFLFHKIQVAGHRESAVAQLFSLGRLRAMKKRKTKKNASSSKTRPKKFPDPATCRVQQSKFIGSLDCLSVWRGICPHHATLESGHFCRHPSGSQFLHKS
jgi:hypothetical protein